MEQKIRARLVAYGVAVVATGVTLLLRLPLVTVIGDNAQLMTFFPAIIFSAYVGGLGPGLLATLLGAAAGRFFLMASPYSLVIDSVDRAYGLGLYVLAGAVISALTESMHRSRRRIQGSERRYAVTLASIGDAVMATDTRARVTFLNPVAEALTGWSLADAVGRPLTEVFHIVNEQTRQPAEDPAAKVFRLGTCVGLANHTALLARDGREAPIDDCAAPIIDDRGGTAGVVLVFRDVSQRRRSEEAEALRRANERMELAVRGSDVGVWESDIFHGDSRDSRPHYVNLWEQLGYDGPPTDRATPLDLVHPDDRAHVDAATRQYLAGETAQYETKARLRHKDGSYRTMLARGAAVRDAGGKPVRFVGILMDITRLKQAEKALRESEQRWRTLTEALPQLVWSAMPDGACDYFSTQWTEHTGVAEADLVGWRWMDTLHPVDREPTRQFWLESVAGCHPYDVEYRVRRRDGEYRWFKTRGVPIRDDGGNIVKWFGTCTDITDLRHTQEALRASERRFRVFVDHAADAFFLHEEGTARVLDVNRRACESLGYSRDELIGMTPFDFDPDFTAALRENLAFQLEAGKTAAFESRHRRKDGTTFPVEVRGQAFREGGRRYLVSLVRDITDRKRAEEALRESEERFRGTFENAAVGIGHIDAAGRWLRVNEKLCAIAGYPREELLRKNYRDITHADDLAAGVESFTALMQGKLASYTLEKWYVRKDGSPVCVELFISLQRDAAGRPDYGIAVIQDISERKRLDAELRQAKEAVVERARLAELGRDVGVALSQGDTLRELLQPCAGAVVRYLDAAFARIWWLPPGSDVLELQASAGLYTHLDGPHGHIPIGRLKIGRIAQDRRSVLTNEVQTDPCISDPDWARREGMVGFAGFPLVVNDRVLGVLGMFSRRPLSEAVLQALESVAGVIALGIERKHQQVELRRAKEAAEASNRAKDEFLANVSHEIRTPMNAILGMTELALETPLSEDQRQCLKTVKSAADNLLAIINDLLDFSKIEAGKLELDPAHFPLRAALGDTLRSLAVRAHKKGLELVSDIQPDVPDALVGDAGRLRQVLLNLVGNSIKFTEHGEVVVLVKPEIASIGPIGPIGPIPAPPDVVLHFEVRDTGIGIPKDKQERIFRAFEQEDTSTTRKYGGTGLGLTIASRLVALMGGQIAVYSEPGRGSTFIFTARFGRQPRQPEPAAAQPPVVLRDLPVLIVDDNATNRHIVERWLRGWQMKATAVGDGLGALDALWHGTACGRPFALVLLDARMPDFEGLALAAQIRQRGELSATRIILLTSGDRPGDLARSRELRVDAHLLKPVQQDELLGTIHQVMSRQVAAGRAVSGDSSDPTLPGPDESSITAPLRILVAEDNEFNAQLLEQLLARRGHRVRVATNGRDALALAAAAEFDLMLLDVHMPELDGFQVVRAVREREQTAGGHLPIVALTARSREQDREQCLAAGMDEFLAKPIQAAALWSAIDRVLRRHLEGGMREEGTRPVTDSSLIPHPSSLPLLDPRVLLAACGDDPAILDKICQAFVARLPDHLAALRKALHERNAPRLREAAHKLSGMLAAFSSVAGGVASDLEDHADRGQLEEAPVLVERLETMAQDLVHVVDGLSVETLRQQAIAAEDPSRTTDG
jgi:PAS domain S-box-containing protein